MSKTAAIALIGVCAVLAGIRPSQAAGYMVVERGRADRSLAAVKARVQEFYRLLAEKDYGELRSFFGVTVDESRFPDIAGAELISIAMEGEREAVAVYAVRVCSPEKGLSVVREKTRWVKRGLSWMCPDYFPAAARKEGFLDTYGDTIVREEIHDFIRD